MKLGIDLSDVQGKKYGGKDAVPINLIQGLVELGHAKEIICFCHEDLSITLKQLSADLTVHILPDYASRFKILQIAKRELNARRLKRYASAAGVDVLLFTNKFTPNCRFSMKTAMITHDIQCFADSVSRQSLKSALLIRRAQHKIRNDFKNRDLIIAISDFDASMCGKVFPENGGKIHRIYNPVSFASSLVTSMQNRLDASNHDSASDSDYIGPVRKKVSGRYITALNIQWMHKNTLTLIKAYERICNQIPLDLVLVGKTPPDYAELLKYIDDHCLKDRITFTGFISADELYRIISETRIYVNPSLFEGFGLTAVEMLYYGIPVIVADCTASPETTRGYAATYSPPDSDLALSEALLNVWFSPPALSERLKASDEMKRMYSPKLIAAQYWDALTNLISVSP